MQRLLNTLSRCLNRKQWERELSEEVEAHREMKRRELEKAGHSAGDLESSVRRELGNITQMKEDSRAVWCAPWLESLAQDLRVEVRQLRKSGGFTVTVISILALGIGVNAAVFTLLNAVALRPLPLADASQLVYVMEEHASGCCSPPSWLDQRDIREQQHSFQSLGAYDYSSSFLFGGRGQTRHLTGGYVTPDYFSTLGVRPVVGGVFTASEAQPGRDNVVLLREDFWRSQLHGDPDILRTTVLVNGRKSNVIGILPAWFNFPGDWNDSVIWTPLVPTKVQASERGWHGFPMVGRLKPGISLSATRADMKAIMWRLSHQYQDDKDRTGAVFSFETWEVEGVKSRLLVLQFSALAVFLMTCANVSSLLLARYSTRRREFAVRAALGASRIRQIRQHLTEAFLLAVIGCTIGLGVAWAGVKLLVLLYEGQMPRISAISIDWRLVLFTAGLTLTGTIIFGLTTAFHENTSELERALRENTRSSAGRSSMRSRQLLVIGQMACSLALLAGSGELIKSFWNLMRVDIGIDSWHLLTMRVDVPVVKYNSPASVASFYDKAIRRIRSLPGVGNAASINMLPIAQSGRNSDVEVEGLLPHSNRFFAEDREITGDYFETMGIPIVRGRNFLPEETNGKERAVVINQTMSRALWKDKNPIGYRLRGGLANSDDWFTVVGVVRDVRPAGLDQPARAEVFAPLYTLDEPLTTQSIVVRSRLGPQQVVDMVRHEIAAVDPEAAIFKVKDMNDVIYDSISGYRITATLLVLFAVLALLLATFGIYGVIAYSVTERRREIAIRMALGAHSAALIGMIFRQGMIMIAIGIACGLCGVFYVTRVLSGLLYGTGGADFPILSAAIVVLTAVASIASLAPAVRAVRVHPMRPLREE